MARATGLGQPAVWRFSVEDIYKRRRRGFASLEALMAFLREQMEDDDMASGEEP